MVKSPKLDKEDQAPHPRAGHSCNLAGTQLFIIGGSYGPNYLRDVSIVETNPAPTFEKKADAKARILEGLLEHINQPEFSDVTFIVEGKKYFAHKLVLSLISDHFRSMFKSGMVEAKKQEIVIEDVSYPIFSSIMNFLYTGEFQFGAEMEGQEHSVDHLHEFLRVSDKYMLEDVKLECEIRLKDYVGTQPRIQEWAEMYNADNLKAYCEWYQTTKK